MWLPMLKHLLINSLALESLWASQISIHITAISNFRKTLIIQDFNVRTISLNMWDEYKTLLTMLAEIEMFVFLMRYEISKILR